MAELETFDQAQFDVLKELANIGSGSAITSLAGMLGNNLRMSVPEVKLLDFNKVSDLMGDPEETVLAVLVNFTGELSGMMMFVVEKESARILIDSFVGKKGDRNEPLSEFEMAAFQEIGNIMSGSYLSALGTVTNSKIRPSTPFVAEDMAAAILSVPAIEFGKMADQALFIESIFEGKKNHISGFFIMVPDMESLQSILATIGVL